MKKIKHFVKTRKVLSIALILMVAGGAYWVYAKSTSTAGQTSYLVAKAALGNVTTTITGTGQVSASSQVEIKSKVSGDLTYLNTAANGQQIKKGTLIAQVDTRDELINLESARIAYQKAVQPATESEVLQAQSGLDDAIASNKKSYEDAFTAISDAFTDLPTVMNGLDSLLYSRNGYLQTENVRPYGQAGMDLQVKAGLSFDAARNEYNNLLNDYKNLSRTSAISLIESFTSKAYLLMKDVSGAVKNTQNTLDWVHSQRNDTTSDATASSLASWSSTVNSDVSSLFSSQTTMKSSAQAVTQKSDDLADLKNGLDPLDLRSQQLSLQQKENTYQDYFIRAPFDGLLAKLSVRSTDSVSSGTAIGTIVSSQKLTTITLNEVDVSKVHVGQKAKLTFDAIDGLTMDGTVSTVDLIGTVSQGVVNYNVEIVLDAQDDRIKSGMSVSASIIIDSRENVVTVPNSAVKTQGKMSYVEVFATPLVVTRGTTGTPSAIPPVRKPVQVGLSSDTVTEITSGLNEGDQVVTRTITSTATTATNAATPSLFGSGTRTGTGGTARFPRN